MSCPDPICRIISCPPTDDLPHYYGQYSLQSGISFDNGVIIVPAPGGGTYTVPPGTIVINVPPGATSVNYQGCQSTISLPIPSGSTPSAIQAIVNQVMQQAAAQLAICNAPDNPHSGGPFPPVTFGNEVQNAFCTDTPGMDLVGDLPPGVTITFTQLSIAAGIFQSTLSVADANAAALAFLLDVLNSQVDCGWWNTEQSFICADSSVQVTPANTFFSTVSQDDADAQALAAAEAACPSSSSLIILKDDEVTNVINIECENIKFVNGLFFFCSYNSGDLYVSPDGLNWSIAVSTVWSAVYDITFGAGLFIAVGQSIGGFFSTYTSPDGVVWTQNITTVNLSRNWRSIVSSGTLIHVGSSQGETYVTTDGFNWAYSGNLVFGEMVYRQRALNGRVIAVVPFTNNTFVSTNDGVSYFGYPQNEPRGMAYGAGLFVVAGNGFLYTSPDAITWTPQVFAGQNNDVIFANGVFNLVTQSKQVFTSPDGFAWTDSGRVAAHPLSAVGVVGTAVVAAEG